MFIEKIKKIQNQIKKEDIYISYRPREKYEVDFCKAISKAWYYFDNSIYEKHQIESLINELLTTFIANSIKSNNDNILLSLYHEYEIENLDDIDFWKVMQTYTNSIERCKIFIKILNFFKNKIN